MGTAATASVAVKLRVVVLIVVEVAEPDTPVSSTVVATAAVEAAAVAVVPISVSPVVGVVAVGDVVVGTTVARASAASVAAVVAVVGGASTADAVADVSIVVWVCEPTSVSETTIASNVSTTVMFRPPVQSSGPPVTSPVLVLVSVGYPVWAGVDPNLRVPATACRLHPSLSLLPAPLSFSFHTLD